MILYGVDVHHGRGDVDWSQVYAAGRRFAFVKATEGTGFVDPKHAANVAGARHAGLAVGSYHYAKPGAGAAVDQARFFAEHLGDLGPGRLAPALDLEETGGLNGRELQRWMSDFLHELNRLTSRTPFLYTGRAFWRAQLGATRSWPLWLARYGDSLGETGWTFWQYSSDGQVPGVAGRCDVDVFTGTQADLDRLALRTAAPAPPKPAPHPATEPEGEDVWTIVYSDASRPTILYRPGEAIALASNAEVKAHQALGYKLVHLTVQEHDALISTAKRTPA